MLMHIFSPTKNITWDGLPVKVIEYYIEKWKLAQLVKALSKAPMR